jgi:hypothetical protein
MDKANQNDLERLLDYLLKESNGKHTEFRLVVREFGTAYIHVMGRNSETFDFIVNDKANALNHKP